MSHKKSTSPATKRKDDWKGYIKSKDYVKKTAAERRISFEETLSLISLQIGNDRDAHDKIYQTRMNIDGQLGVIEVLRGWATEFEQRNKDREWDGEWFEEIDEFIDEKLKDLI